MKTEIEYARSPAWKFAIDYGIGIPLTIACLPLMALVFVAVRIFLGAPAIFRQARPGLNGRVFVLYKFRTMTGARAASGELLPDAQRLTALGKFLRSTSLDELPELFNVMKGDMSLVGPRPLLVKYLPYYTAKENLRHTIKPGITGWAQINGRNGVPWNERLAMDVWYVENAGPQLDLLILRKTLLKVLAREGVAADADTAESCLDEERARRNL